MNENQKRFIRLKEVIKRTSLSRSTIYAWMKSGCFPKNIIIGTRTVAWDEAVINDWIESKIKEAAQ